MYSLIIIVIFSNWNVLVDAQISNSLYQELVASDGEYLDYFGNAVSNSNDVIVVGAEGDDDNGFDSGAAYVFTRGIDGSFNQIQN